MSLLLEMLACCCCGAAGRLHLHCWLCGVLWLEHAGTVGGAACSCVSEQSLTFLHLLDF